MWGGIASFGLGAQGYNDYTNAQADRDYLAAQRVRDTEVHNIELERARRMDAVAQRTRQIAADYGLGGANQLPATQPQDVTIPQAISVDDEGVPLPDATKTVPGLPAQANREGMYEAMAQAHEANGNLAEAANIRKTVQQMHDEGYSGLLKGVVAGEDPSMIAQRFNQKGDHRIVNGEKSGDAYTFTYDDGRTSNIDKAGAQDVGARMGIFKKDITIVPHDATAIDASGNVVAHGKDSAKNTPDPFQLEEFKADLRDRSERLKASLAHKADGRPREVALAEAFVTAGVAPDMKEALVMATEGKNLSPERFRANLLSRLAADSTALTSARPEDAAKARQALAQTADEITKIAFPARPATGARPQSPAAAPASSTDGVPDIQRDIAAANARDPAPAPTRPPAAIGDATFTGRYTREGKPFYRTANGSIVVGE